MAHQRTHPHTHTSRAIVPVVLFGVDDHGKPKAARFIDKHADLAAKAAGHLNLQVLQVTAPALAELADRLPVGRIHANGRGFVPYIRRDLYGKLVAAASSPAQSGEASSGQTGFPKSWDQIARGHVVIVEEGPLEGWYEAVVVEAKGDLLTMQWLDYPRERRFTRHRSTVALLYPHDSSNVENNSKAPQTSKSKAVAKQQPAEAKAVYPHDWKEIDIGSLVLAKDDGPWRAWWEAVVSSKSDQTLTLRWRETNQMSAMQIRNFADTPTISRPRWAVGLLYPNGR